MYTPHQIDCMQQLGVSFLQPVVPPKKADSESTSVQDVLLPESLLTDLKVVFPDLLIDGERIHLTNKFSWLIQANTTRVIATKTQLITPSLNVMTHQHWRKVWEQITDHAVPFG